jgi:hypothetical protein
VTRLHLASETSERLLTLLGLPLVARRKKGARVLWEPVRRLCASLRLAILECNTQRFLSSLQGNNSIPITRVRMVSQTFSWLAMRDHLYVGC